MSEFGLFWNSRGGDRKYDADDFAEWLRKFFTNGVFNGELFVTSTGGMGISVGSGYVNVQGKVMFFEAPTSLTLDVAYEGYNRTDAVVVEMNRAERDFSIKILKGEPAGEPPTPTRSDGIYQLVLSHITVADGVTEITQSDIVDKRLDPDLCGYVTGTVEEIDFSQITAQWETYFTEFKEEYLDSWETWSTEQRESWDEWSAAQRSLWTTWFSTQQADFDAWYQHMKDQLDEDAAGHLQGEIDEINEALDALPVTLDTTFEKKHFITEMVISASDWNGEGEYSFESVFPTSEYDILDITPQATATHEQRMAWAKAECGGYYPTNYIKAFNTIPEIDIPMTIEYRLKL